MTTSIAGQGIIAYKAPDDALSNESKNAVQNKVVNKEVNDLQRMINEKASVIINKISDDIATFADGADGMPIKHLIVNIEAVQEGSGDPSPTNVRPITGWTGLTGAIVGENLFGGLTLANKIKTVDPSAVINTDSGTVRYSSADIGEKVLFNKFRPNTQYTFISDYTGTYTNLIWRYADNTYGYIGSGASVSSPNNSVIAIEGYQRGGNTVLNYNDCGLFEGVITADAFVPYQGDTISVSWQSEAGTVYGGTLDLVTGGLTVTHAEIDLGTLNWNSNTSLSFQRFFANIDGKANGQTNIICSQFAIETDPLGVNQQNNTIKGISSTNAVYVRADEYSDAATFKTAVSGVQLVYELATPQTYHLDPVTVNTLLGNNTVYVDCGSVMVDYPADTKLYIDSLTVPDNDMIADGLIASGKYFTVNNQLYLSTAQIAAGAQIIPGSNCTATSITEALNVLNS